MLGKIWSAIILSCTLFMLFGCADEFTSVLYEGLSGALELCLSLAGIMAFWGGMMEVADRSGVTAVFSKVLSPAVNLIFPDVCNDIFAKKAISMNITANILGLGNAATPLGIEAMKRLHTVAGKSDTASDSMVTFVIINTASVQLIPVTTAALRAKFGSNSPMSILPAVLLASVMSLVVGLAVDRVICSKGRVKA